MITTMALAHEATELLQRLIRFNTVNPPGNERPAQEMLRAVLEAAGFECELIGATEERPNLIARLPRPLGGPRSVTWATSTRCSPMPSEWTVDPWSGELRDGYVWGRGALDMKGQVACEVAAACELGRSGWRPERGELMVVVTCDEEAGATIGAQWLCEQRPGEGALRHGRERGRGRGARLRGTALLHALRGREGGLPLRLSTEGRAGHASMPASATTRCCGWSRC